MGTIVAKRVYTEKDLDYNIIPSHDGILVFVDKVLYAKKMTMKEAKKALKKVVDTRKFHCYF